MQAIFIYSRYLHIYILKNRQHQMYVILLTLSLVQVYIALTRNSQLGSSGYNWAFDVVKPHKNFRIQAFEYKKKPLFFNATANIYFLYYEHYLKVCIRKRDVAEKNYKVLYMIVFIIFYTVTRPFQERRVIAHARTHTHAKVFRRAINCTLK